jgi:hypothetical protein
MTSPCKADSSTDRQQEQSDQPGWKDILNNPRYIVIGSIALLTFVLTVAFIIPDMLRRTDQPSDRARVTIQGATIVGPLIQHNVPRATILFHNSGRSPALTTQIRLVMTVWTSSKFHDREMSRKLKTEATSVGEIRPGAVVSQTVSLTAPLTDVQGIHLERKDWFIVTLGVVSYVDIFGNPHETTLCLIWREPSTERLSPCGTWNDAD